MKKITFTLPAEALGTATEALLLGDFNEWNPEKGISLSMQPDGTLAATVDLVPGQTYQYRFLLNNGTWVNDWAAAQYVYNPDFGISNSVITVAADVEKKPKKTTSTSTTTKTKAKEKNTTTESKSRKTKVTPTKDDLTKIEGIGSKIAKLLEAEGIKTFKDLGEATAKKLNTILNAAGSAYQIHNPASWPKQAKLAAAEKWDELAILQKELIAGK